MMFSFEKMSMVSLPGKWVLLGGRKLTIYLPVLTGIQTDGQLHIVIALRKRTSDKTILADRTNSRAYATVLRLSSSVALCSLLWLNGASYSKSYWQPIRNRIYPVRNRLVPKWMEIKWSRDRWRRVTLKGQTRDPNIRLESSNVAKTTAWRRYLVVRSASDSLASC